MNFRPNKSQWISIGTLSIAITLWSYHEIKFMKNAYKQDFGNGVIVYADEYVKTGNWVFDCKNSRLISRTPLPAPLTELESAKKFIIGNMFYLKEPDKKIARDALSAATEGHDWYKSLRYLYSALDEDSNLNSHMFYLITQHADRTWAVEVDQLIDHDGRSRFKLYATPYDAETYVDYAKALQAAQKSCPKPQ